MLSSSCWLTVRATGDATVNACFSLTPRKSASHRPRRPADPTAQLQTHLGGLATRPVCGDDQALCNEPDVFRFPFRTVRSCGARRHEVAAASPGYRDDTSDSITTRSHPIGHRRGDALSPHLCQPPPKAESEPHDIVRRRRLRVHRLSRWISATNPPTDCRAGASACRCIAKQYRVGVVLTVGAYRRDTSFVAAEPEVLLYALVLPSSRQS